MLIIRQAQMDALGQARMLEFEDRVLARMQKQYPVDYSALGDDGALDLARFTIRSGVKHGIRDEKSLQGLLRLYVEFGREFEIAPYAEWARQILGHERLAGPVKVNLIQGRLFGLTQGRRIIRHTEQQEG